MTSRYTQALVQAKKDLNRKTVKFPQPLVLHLTPSALREALKVPAAQLAKELGISKSYLSMIENGTRAASEELATKIRDALLGHIANRQH